MTLRLMSLPAFAVLSQLSGSDSAATSRSIVGASTALTETGVGALR